MNRQQATLFKLRNERDALKKELCKYADIVEKLKHDIEEKTTEIQNNCPHEWVTEVQPYQREVFCKHCLLMDWEKTRYY